MPKDERLYMTFPIDFDEHPKVEPLSDAAFRTFVSMNGYSRRQRLDGVIPVGVARKRWKVRALSELVASHPERPLVALVDDCYVLRDYAQHQFTTADEQELHDKRAAAGARGGKATATAKALAKQSSSKTAAESESRSESESGIKTDVTKATESGQVSETGNPEFDGLDDVVRQRAQRARITDLSAVRKVLARSTNEVVSLPGAVMLVEAIVSKSKRPVDDVDAYVAVVCRRSAAEVQQAYFDLDIGAVA